ncbi:SH3 domain-containing protein [Celeribacter litoreus]|uniref:SH3 domain-containing protein n=1 Tax=Celeribacter litoreus TaxID=2876714 RepID=UPI001CCD3007|nr:SH3 domain-containing protein [Celeribacter litoreus]MCA0043897.1 SH3 domain-containing protein [Celeribacter litoreus]
MNPLKTNITAALVGATVLAAPLATAAQAQTQVQTQARADYIVGSSYLNARSGPGTEYHVVTVLEPGTPVNAVAQQGSWVQIASPGAAPMWVYGTYLAPVTTPAEANTLLIVPQAKPDPSKPSFEGQYPLVIRQ